MGDEAKGNLKSLHGVLLEARGWLTIEELIRSAGYQFNNLDEFYQELRKEIDLGTIIVVRADSFDAKFIAAEHWR
jgi:hypothetical protein